MISYLEDLIILLFNLLANCLDSMATLICLHPRVIISNSWKICTANSLVGEMINPLIP